MFVGGGRTGDFCTRCGPPQLGVVHVSFFLIKYTCNRQESCTDENTATANNIAVDAILILDASLSHIQLKSCLLWSKMQQNKHTVELRGTATSANILKSKKKQQQSFGPLRHFLTLLKGLPNSYLFFFKSNIRSFSFLFCHIELICQNGHFQKWYFFLVYFVTLSLLTKNYV